jgi:malate dehydrogenase
MSFIAVIGGGALGGALAHKLAARNRVVEVRLIDPEARVAEGKALDILQSAPVEQFSTRVTAAGSIAAAAGADAIVIADAAAGSVEHAGESGLALLRQIARFVDRVPIVFAGAGQRELMARTTGELHLSPSRVLGSAPYALESAVRALAALSVDGSGAEISLRVVGVPPRAAVVAWEEATVAGDPLTSHIPAHAIAALNSRLVGLWPPGPYALASAAARVAEALAHGSRRRYSCFVAIEAGPLRGSVVAMPVELRRGGIARVVEPSLTRLERTILENGVRTP